MKCLILAAGYGTRLGDLTKNKPKPLIEVNGKSVIEGIIDSLHVNGITQIIVNLHYLPTVITERIISKALYYYEPRLLGHDGTINALKEWLRDDDFFVINGDTITNVDYMDMIKFHKNGTIETITVLMDQWRCAGTWIYSKEYFATPNLPVIPYRPVGLEWHDIGTLDRLKETQEFYGKI